VLALDSLRSRFLAVICIQRQSSSFDLSSWKIKVDGCNVGVFDDRECGCFGEGVVVVVVVVVDVVVVARKWKSIVETKGGRRKQASKQAMKQSDGVCSFLRLLVDENLRLTLFGVASSDCDATYSFSVRVFVRYG
jgi:hypothetical protein